MKRLASLVFSNKNWLQVVLKNTFWVSASEGVIRLSRAGIVVLMARVLGPDGYGSFAFAFATASMFTFIFDAGLAPTITRDFAKNSENEKLFPEILSLKLVLALLGISAISISSIFIADDNSIRMLMLVLGLYFMVVDFETSLFLVFRARQRMEYEALVRILVSLGLVTATAIILWRAASPMNMAYVFLGTSCASISISFWVRRKITGNLAIRINPSVWLKFLKASIPIGATGALAGFYFSLDSTMLGLIGTFRDTGLYSAVSRIAYFLVLPGTVLSAVLIPALSAASSSGSAFVNNRLSLWMVINLALGGFMVAFFWTQNEEVIDLLYGDEFRESAKALKLLVLTTLAIYVYYPWYTALIVYEKQNWLLLATIGGLVVNVALTASLIPFFGITGAAVSSIGTHGAIMLGFAFFTKKGTPIAPINRIWFLSAISSLGATAMAYFITSMFASSLWMAVPLCAVTFAISFLAIGKVVGLTHRMRSLLSDHITSST